MLQGLSLVVALALPAGAWAVPVTLAINTGSQGGMSFSFLHSADSCELNGFWRCGSNINAVTAGALTADQSGIAFSNIQGSFSAGGTTYAVTGGSLDFGAAAGTVLGHLDVTGLGTFTFYNLRHGTQIANTFDAASGTGFLWGQTFAPSSVAQKGWGIDLGFTAAPAIPEPNAALLFGVGGLIVLRRSRRSKA